MSDMNKLEEEISRVKWYHSIDLGGGVTTPGMIDCRQKLKDIAMPETLLGRTVLDIGAWDGFFSFEAERRGARRILAVDSFAWNGGWEWGTKTGFNLARRILNSKVEDLNMEVLDLSPERVGVFDLVFFLGVLYHMRHPLLALEKVFSVTGEQLILQTQIDMLEYDRPAVAFYPESELNDDSTNWWGPNPVAVEAMLKSVGFRKTKIISINKGPDSKTYGNMAIHAWR